MNPTTISMKDAYRIEHQAFDAYNNASYIEGKKARKITHRLHARWQRRVSITHKAIARHFGHQD